MKQLLFFCLLLFVQSTFAQNLTGEVKDEVLKSAINAVQVIHQSKTVLTNANGQFLLPGIKAGDRISFRIMGYETKEMAITTDQIKSVFTVYLKPTPFELQTVNIRAPRNHQHDSLMLRKEYAAVFNYKAPTFSDMFVKINSEEKVPLALSRPASTSSLVKVNVLQVMSLFGKKKSQTSKLKSKLLADEASSFIDQRFSKTKVQSITSLQGDSLTLFLQRFKPTADELRKMNDYQLSIYIKEKYVEFAK